MQNITVDTKFGTSYSFTCDKSIIKGDFMKFFNDQGKCVFFCDKSIVVAAYPQNSVNK